MRPRGARVATRILSAVAVGIAALAAISVLAGVRLAAVQNAADSLYDVGLTRTTAIDEVTARMFEVRGHVNRIVLDEAPTTIAQREQQIATAEQGLTDALARYLDSYDRQPPPAVAAAYDRVTTVNDRRQAVITGRLIPLARRNDDEAAKAVIDGDLAAIRTEMASAVGDLATIEHDNAAALKERANRTARSAREDMALAAVIGAALALAVGLWATRSVTRPVAQVRRTLNLVAEGDLRTRCTVGTHDELGDMAAALNATLDQTQQVVAGILGVAATLASSSEELAAASNQVSGNVSIIATTTEEMHASVDHIARSAEDVNQVAIDAVDLGTSAAELVDRLSQSSQAIGGVVDVISGIAKQTNLLALNATIEAARAGASGKGFAVVASEVKDLAQASSSATDSIRSQIETIQVDAVRATEAIQQIGRVIDHIRHSQQIVTEAVEEQSAATAEMSNQLSQIAIVSQALASGTTGTGPQTASAADLAHLAGELKVLVQHFQVS